VDLRIIILIILLLTILYVAGPKGFSSPYHEWSWWDAQIGLATWVPPPDTLPELDTLNIRFEFRVVEK